VSPDCANARLAGSFSALSFQPVEKPPKQQSVGSYDTRCCKPSLLEIREYLASILPGLADFPASRVAHAGYGFAHAHGEVK
jgi:hypothetical protein